MNYNSNGYYEEQKTSINEIPKNISGVKLDENKMDVRVFLIPHRESTLGHYLAMYDDLYC
jgi:hypothetical protein